jgi:glycosyltransferase involved in cell wall biosynthesis
VVNGGNCPFGDVNWVHYVHAACEVPSGRSWLRRIRGGITRRCFLRDERRALRRAQLVIANSERTRRHLLDLHDLAPERVRVVYLGTEPRQFREPTSNERADTRRDLGVPEDSAVAVFIGALGDRRKGFDSLFAAWSELCRSPDWDGLLLVVGTGGDLPAWRKAAEENGLDCRVRFLGFRGDVPRMLWASDLLVAPTRYEPYGLGVHEALCSGVPALVSANAGAAERYPDDLRDMLIPNPDDVSDLVSRLRTWRVSIASWRGRVAALASDLRQRTWDDMAAEMLRVIEES